MRQMAYARKILGGEGTSKKGVALDVGYSPNVANSVSSHIENTSGFNCAMAKLAVDSNNLALAAMHEFKARGFEGFTNKELVGALNAIGSAWSKFNQAPKEKGPSQSTNKLRTVILQQVENQTIKTDNSPSSTTPITPEEEQAKDSTTSTLETKAEVIEVVDVEDPLDF